MTSRPSNDDTVEKDEGKPSGSEIAEPNGKTAKYAARNRTGRRHIQTATATVAGKEATNKVNTTIGLML
jgi:hypothetical protein